ncbi:unnamed protein product [Mytilus edulis]|uniref:Uncharacterized protein n=1 Tax=Mytilus edulis TaxID=6550 RepID=A0A8S3RFA8_MYTED|nr:unnamed protein product [Mytilus edulis]
MSKRKLQRYIEEQPHRPSGIRYKVPILISDSKGYCLRDACKQYNFPIESWCISGARTSALVDLLENRIEKAIQRHHHIVVYFWAGTCDLTHKEGKFIELRHKGNTSIETIEKEYQRAIAIVNKYSSAEIKFLDCPVLSISTWNKRKGHKHPEDFKNQDSLITKQITALNKTIWKINSTLRKNSIKVSRYFFRGRKRKGRSWTRRTVNLSINNKDGVHPGQSLSLAITKHILLDTYKECYQEVNEKDILVIDIEIEETNSLL